MGQIIIAYKTKLPDDSTTTKGDEATVTGNLVMTVSDATIEYFNIPVPADPTELVAAKSVIVKSFTYTRYTGIDDTTGTSVTVPDYEKGLSGGRKGGGRHVAIVPTELKSAKDNFRTVSFRFPSFFNIVMIDQCIGSMIKAHQPTAYKLHGLTRAFIANASTDVVAPATTGAWVATALITPVNVDKTEQVAGVTESSSGRTAKTTATPTP